MKTVQAIIDRYGGIESFAHVTLRVSGFMPLWIENVGYGPNGGPRIAVAHWFTQNGDVMRDPEVEFEVREGEWLPLSYRQDSIGLMQEAIIEDATTHKVFIHPKLLRDLQSFVRTWDQNLKDQGFLDATVEE